MAARDRKRRRRRRGRFSFLYKLLSVIVIIVALVAGSVVFFRVNDVVVAGNQRYTAQEVLEASGIREGDNLFLVNKNRAAGMILQKLPYVDKVSIRRQLPQGIVIQISESGAAAAIECEGTTWLLNYRGKVLGTAEEDDSAPLVTGLNPLRPTAGTQLTVAEEESGKLGSLLELMNELKENDCLDKVGSYDLTMESRITFRYDDRYTVVMPMTTDFAKKVRAMAQVVGSEQIGETGTIDFTIEDAPHFIPGS